jgi:manganese efflux pump family protein
LCLDTFAVAFAVLGEVHLTRAQRKRAWVLFIAFEAGMPLAGMALGAPLAHLAGSPAHVVVDPYQLGSPNEAYLGILMLDEALNDDDDEAGKARALVAARGLSVIALGLGISVDELRRPVRARASVPRPEHVGRVAWPRAGRSRTRTGRR